MSLRKSKVAFLEALESRTLLSTTPLVMGYLVDFKISDNANKVFSEKSDGSLSHDSLDWKDLKEVNYFALLPNASPAFNTVSLSAASESAATSDGGLQSKTDSGFDPNTQLPTVVSEAKNHGAKAYVTVGGGDANAIYSMDALVNTPSAWANFAGKIKSFATKFGLAGVDLDWEPTAQDGFVVTQTQIENFGKLVKAIKSANPSLKLTADALGDPVEISTSSGSDTGKSAFMLDATAVQNLDAINVEAYPVGSKSESDTIMKNWASYSTDLDGNSVGSHTSKLQYGLDIASDDSSNKPAGVIEGKVDLTVSKGYGGIFVFELNSDTGSPSVISRIGTEITKDIGGGGATGGSVSGTVSSTKGGGVGGVTIYLDANNNSSRDSGELAAITASDGTYSFTSVPVGAYIIRQMLPSGDTQTSPSSGFGIHITVTSTSKLTGENFTDSVAGGGGGSGGGSVSGTVTSTKGSGVGGITIYLDKNNNSTLDSNELSTTTASNGSYSFTSVPAAAYIIRQKLPSGDTQTSPSSGFGIHVTVTSTSTSKFTGENFVDSVSGSTGPAQLTGTVIGSSTSLSNAKSGHPASNAFDDKTSTTFEDTQANGNWIGLDLGKSFSITQIKYAADSANPSFMEGGEFQASSHSDFSSNIVNLFAVPNTSTPSTSLTSVNVNSNGGFRYVRYLAPAGSFGDVAEIEFFGTAT